jgi:hypothetical protein
MALGRGYRGMSRFALGFLDQPAAGGGGAWSPLDFGADLLGWWDAQDNPTITQAGGTVSQWADKSGLGKHLAQNGAQQPAYNATAMGGSRPAIVQTVGNEHLTNTSFSINAAAFTLIGVWYFTTPVNAGGRVASFWAPGQLEYDNASSLLILLTTNSDVDLQTYHNSLTPKTFNTNLSGATPYWIIAEFDGTDERIYVNGALSGSPVACALGTLSASGTFSLGNSPNFNEGYVGGVGELIAVKRSLTSGERTNLASYFARWGF